MGFTVTLADEEEAKRRLYEDAGWEYATAASRTARVPPLLRGDGEPGVVTGRIPLPWEDRSP